MSIAYDVRLKRPRSNNGMKFRTVYASWYINQMKGTNPKLFHSTLDYFSTFCNVSKCRNSFIFSVADFIAVMYT